MFGIGMGELALIFVIALVVLGPERMPKLARDLGRIMNELRKASDELTSEFLKADQDTAHAAPPGAPSPLQAPSEPTPPRQQQLPLSPGQQETLPAPLGEAPAPPAQPSPAEERAGPERSE